MGSSRTLVQMAKLKHRFCQDVIVIRAHAAGARRRSFDGSLFRAVAACGLSLSQAELYTRAVSQKTLAASVVHLIGKPRA
jgi:hypothetical protein